MKIEVYNDKALGTLYYDYPEFYDHIHVNRDVLNFIIKRNGLEVYMHYDFIENVCRLQCSGSITNMLRFRNTLKHIFGLCEKDLYE